MIVIKTFFAKKITILFLQSAFISLFLVSAELSFAQHDLSERLLLASPNAIEIDEELKTYMHTLAESAISEHCAGCHGADLTGQLGVPNLVDGDWLWGVTGLEMTRVEPVMEIMQTIMYGIRNDDCSEDIKQYGACPDTRFSQMPAYSKRLTQQEISDLVEYVIGLSHGEADAQAIARGAEQWFICAECHGDEGYGYKPFGGPDLSDNIWLFGSGKDQINHIISNGSMQACPAWGKELDAVTIKALAVYIFSKI